MKKPSREKLAKRLVACLGAMLIGWVLYRAPLTRELGVHGLGLLGGHATPLLRRAIQDEDPRVQRAAREALERVGPAAVPSLVETLKSGDAAGRAGAAGALIYLAQRGRDITAAVDALTEAAGDADAAVRATSIRALWSVCADGKELLPLLLAGMKDPDAHARAEAAEALGRIGPRARAATPALKEALNDPDKRVREEAAEALESVARGGED
jgi:HEAT repeat protein